MEIFSLKDFLVTVSIREKSKRRNDLFSMLITYIQAYSSLWKRVQPVFRS